MKNKLLLLAMGFALTTQMIFSQVPSYVPTNGLVGYWGFNGNANDQSGNSNNGTVNGATLTTDRFGNSNGAYSFDGVNDYILVNNNASLCPIVYSISAWVKPNGYYINGQDEANYILGKGVDFNVGHYSLHYNSFNRKARASINTVSNGLYVDSNSNINLNDWVHLVSTWDGNTLKIYVNGILENSIYSPNNVQGVNSENLYFGTMAGNSTWPYWLNGKIDDIAIYNRALTQQEITNLYNSTSTSECLTMTINTGVLSTSPVTYTSSVNIYPNPANDQITIDCGNLANVVGWNINITNMLGQEVFNQPMNTQQYVVPLNSWTGQGMYFVKIINAQNEVVNIKKIILQ